LQEVKLSQLRRVYDARPVPVHVHGTATVSGMGIGNIYDGRYNRSRLLRPNAPATGHYELWEVSKEATWLPVAHDGHYARVPKHAAHVVGVSGNMDCAGG
jgi:hypothetical protein